MKFHPNVERWRAITVKHMPEKSVDKLLWTILHESSGDPNMLGDGGLAVGLLQIHSNESFAGRPTKEWLLDPENNIQYAATTLGAASGNWAPWGEKTLFNGVRFGALGNHPWPGGLVFTLTPVTGFPVTGTFFQTDDVWTPGNPHRGIDFGCPTGTPVLAPAAGNVVSFTNDGGFGIAVCIDHPDTPWYSLYAHLSRADVKVGDSVTAGQQLGLSGATGRVTGAHLHWQVSFDKSFPTDIAQSADPMAFFGVGEETPRDMTEANRWKLMQTAFGDFTRMVNAYDKLRAAGLVPDDGLPGFNYSSTRLSHQFSNLNNAMVRRTRLAELAAGDRFQEAYDLLKKG